jgi:hypothetical protein
MATHFHVTETNANTGTIHFESEGFPARDTACDYLKEIVQHWIGDPNEYVPHSSSTMIRRGKYVLAVRECTDVGCGHETY